MRTALLVGCILFAATGNLLLKHGMSQMGSIVEASGRISQYILETAMKPQIVLGVILYVASFIMWLSLLSIVDISAAYPIFVSAAFLIVMIASVFLLGEHLTALRILGTMVVALGILMVSRG